MNSSGMAKKTQWKIASILLGVVLVLGMVTLSLFEGSPKTKKELASVTVPIMSPGDRLNVERLWRNKMEDAQDAFEKQIKALQALLTEHHQKEQAQGETLRALQSELLTVQEKVTSLGENPGVNTPPTEASNTNLPPPVLIKKLTLNLKESKKRTPSKTILDTIPVGAFAKAVMLSGMDASSAMNAASNPIPLLLRLVDPGTLPRYFKSDLKDCHCTASGYGDISSERIHVRLEKLSCIERATGEIISTEVAGFIAGPDGREGIRGTLVSKEGQYLSRSAMGGLFSGLAKVASPNRGQGMTNPFGLGPSLPTPSTKELFQSGFLEGSGSAMDKLSQYYINRAEQLQPVIQVPGGQVVDLVFTEAANIGETELKAAIAKTRDKARAKAIQNLSPSSQMNSNNPFYTGENHEHPEN